MASLNSSFLRKFVCFFVGLSDYVFGLMNKFMLRLKGESQDTEQKIIDTMIYSNGIGSEREADFGVEESKFDVFKDKEEPESYLSFRFQRYEEFVDGVKGSDGGFINSNLEEVVDDHEVDSLSGSSSDDEFYDPSYDFPVLEDSDGSLCDGDDPCVIPEAASIRVDDKEDSKAKKGDDHCGEKDEFHVPKDAKLFADEEDNDIEVLLGSDLESVASSSNFSLRSSLLDSMKDGYLSSSSSSSSDDDDDDKIDQSMLKRLEDEKENNNNQQSTQSRYKLSQEEAEFKELSRGYETDDPEEDEDLLAELKGIENDVAKDKRVGEYGKYREQNSPEEDESNGMETQWEHQDLIEQLRMEIGKVKAIGLPTIFEDSEPPKMAQDMKLFEKLFRTTGTMDEVQKFYKSYRERMRKFDIFNYQKMYAIGFLRLKDPLQSFSPQKISLATIVSQDCWPCKPKSSTWSGKSSYSVVKFTRELESDLETVYVGQLCLSWEFLCWEYGKALALWDSDPHETRRFNEVAGEFQQFQVLLQRFLEDEPFRNSGRVQNYVKNRCINRRLLQVPVIREDSAKDKMKQRRIGSTSKDAVTSVIIIEMIEESIRLLWQLVRTDKDATTSSALSSRKAANVDLQNPEDTTLLLEVQETLKQKHKKLKELTRSECCILNKLKRNHIKQNYAGRVLCFFSQVDTKLVSRVLNMTRLTREQLTWCCSKLENIEFVDNQIRREPSFLLFPCS